MRDERAVEAAEGGGIALWATGVDVKEVVTFISLNSCLFFECWLGNDIELRKRAISRPTQFKTFLATAE